MTWWQLAFLITGIVLVIQGISIVVAVTLGPRFLAWLTERLFKAMTEDDSIKKRLKPQDQPDDDDPEDLSPADRIRRRLLTTEQILDLAIENGEPAGIPFDPFELDAAQQAIEQILRGEDP